MSCFIRGCNTRLIGKGKENEKRLAMFRPTSDEILRLWQNSVPNGHLLRMHHKICELHFKNEEVDKEFVLVLPDGNIRKLAKDKCSLKKGSVPSIFSTNENSISTRSTLSSIVRGKENHQEVDGYNVQKNNIILDDGVTSVHLEEATVEYINDSITEEIINEQFGDICNILMQNPHAIELPGAWIAQVINTGVKCITWTEWKAKYSGIAKRIVLFTDMTLNIYINEAPVSINNEITKVKNISDLAKLISYVSNTIFPCEKIDGADRPPTCPGYIIRRQHSPGPKVTRCAECTKFRTNFTRRVPSNSQIVKLKERRKRCIARNKNLKKVNNRLKEQIAKLKETPLTP